MRYLSALSLLFLFLIYGCATTEKSTEEESEEEVSETYSDEELTPKERLLLQTRSKLSNHYSENREQVPEVFLQEIIVEERERDPYAGYRVQLLSTRNVAEADSVRDHFVAWADSAIAGYEPDAYVIFRSPHYRVRAGDFQDRDRAIHFSGMLKSRYPDAWIVHERIEPAKVPADTSEIRFKVPQELQIEEEIQMLEENRDSGSENGSI